MLCTVYIAPMAVGMLFTKARVCCSHVLSVLLDRDVVPHIDAVLFSIRIRTVRTSLAGTLGAPAGVLATTSCPHAFSYLLS